MKKKEKNGFVIPERFKIFGHTYTVEYDNKIQSEFDAIGRANYRKHVIKVQSQNEGNCICRSSVEEVYFHEITHTVLVENGYSKLSKDEAFVKRIGKALHQIFVTMEGDLDSGNRG